MATLTQRITKIFVILCAFVVKKLKGLSIIEIEHIDNRLDQHQPYYLNNPGS
jgi:hypothetical protein